MNDFKTEQESFWAGEFGDNYVNRNSDDDFRKSNLDFFKEVFRKADKINSVIEFGPNSGQNLLAIRDIIAEVKLSAIEINDKAVRELKKIDNLKVYHSSLLDFKPDFKRNLVLIKGVLIHLNPDVLNDVYDLLYNSSDKYICIAEYYNPTPVTVNYRGHNDRLFKRDFAGEMLDRFKDLKLVDYGFKYHRENKYFDDMNWFLLEK